MKSVDELFLYFCKPFLGEMVNCFYRTYKKLRCRCVARHSYGFGVHSPYMYHFTRYVVYEHNPFYVYETIEALRASLRRRADKVSVGGDGLGKTNPKERRLKDIARTDLLPVKYAQLLFRVVRFCRCKTLLELGTSLGVTTAYLASAAKTGKCLTIECEPEVASVALENFKTLRLENVELLLGNVDDKLPEALAELDALDFVFINVGCKADDVWRYFELCAGKARSGSVIVVADIYGTKEMEKVWKRIREYGRVTSTIDLGRLGMVFFNTDLHRKNYRMCL